VCSSDLYQPQVELVSGRVIGAEALLHLVADDLAGRALNQKTAGQAAAGDLPPEVISGFWPVILGRAEPSEVTEIERFSPSEYTLPVRPAATRIAVVDVQEPFLYDRIQAVLDAAEGSTQEEGKSNITDYYSLAMDPEKKVPGNFRGEDPDLTKIFELTQEVAKIFKLPVAAG